MDAAGPGAEGGRWERLPSAVQRLAQLGSAPSDDDEVRLRKRVLNLTSALIAALTPIWTITYLALGLSLSAAIPLTYMIATIMFIVAHSRTRLYRAFRFGGLLMMLVFPVLLQWSLGGFANGSFVSLWALTAPLGAMFFAGTRQSLPWFGGFVALVVASVILEPALADSAPEVPEAVKVTFFGLNLFAVSLTVYLVLHYFVHARELEQARSERLLLNILPAPTARRLKHSNEVIADSYADVTVLFADLVEFTPLVESMQPDALVRLLDRVFSCWDKLASDHGLEKIKTVGDEYMVVGGLPEWRPDHAQAVARMALRMQAELAGATRSAPRLLEARIGIDTGPVIAGVIGRSKFSYDLWGDTVNTASRMESTGEPGEVQVTARTAEHLADDFLLVPRGSIEVKGKGSMRTWLLAGEREAVGAGAAAAARGA